MRLALIVEYDGTGYSGFQYQRDSPSIQEQLEKSITALTGEAVRVGAAGRTDARTPIVLVDLAIVSFAGGRNTRTIPDSATRIAPEVTKEPKQSKNFVPDCTVGNACEKIINSATKHSKRDVLRQPRGQHDDRLLTARDLRRRVCQSCATLSEAPKI